MGQPGRASAPPARQPRGSVMVIGNRTSRSGRAVSACRVFVVAALVAAAGVGRAADGPGASPVLVAPLTTADPCGRMDFSAPAARMTAGGVVTAAGTADPRAGSGIVQASGCASCGVGGDPYS